jgi:hypothetical protein
MRKLITLGRIASIGICLLTLEASANAQVADPVGQSQQHFQAGKAAYDANDPVTALREFNAADELHGSSTIDYYLALVHDRLGHRELAVRFYRRYLEGAPDAPNRAAVEQRVNTLEVPAANDIPPVPGSTSPLPPPYQGAPQPNTAALSQPAPQEDLREIEAAVHRTLYDEYQVYLHSADQRRGRAFSEVLWRKARVRKYIGEGLTFGGLGMLVLGVGAGFGEFAAEGNEIGRDPLGNSPTTIGIIATFGGLGIACIAVGGYFWSHYGKEESALRWYRHGRNLALSFTVGSDPHGAIARGLFRF